MTDTSSSSEEALLPCSLCTSIERCRLCEREGVKRVPLLGFGGSRVGDYIDSTSSTLSESSGRNEDPLESLDISGFFSQYLRLNQP